MNTNYNLSLVCEATYKDYETEFEFDPYNDCNDLDGLKDIAVEKLKEEIEDDEIEIEASDIQVEITDFDEVPVGWQNYVEKTDLWEFAEAFAECEQDIDVVEAALYLGVTQIDEAYQGSYKDDEDFARETAEQLGAIDRKANWPQNCIDWETAAKELMYDYSEHNGHYFRCL